MTSAYFIHILVALFAIANPFGNLAIFIGMMSGHTAQEQRKTVLKMSIAILIILLLTIWFGSSVLAFFGISQAAFEMGGSLIIILIGLGMLKSQKEQVSHHQAEINVVKEKTDVSVVPLATPIVAGPGTITATLVFTKHLPTLYDRGIMSVIAIVLTALIFTIFISAPLIGRALGKSGLNIATRISGLILVAIAFTMLIASMRIAFPGLT